MTAVTRDDLKSIAITSAIAAAGTALATSVVEIVLTRYVLKDDEESVSSEPTFVVVPVVDRPVPPLPVAGLGAYRGRKGIRLGPMSRKGRKRAMDIAMRSAIPMRGFGAASPVVVQAAREASPSCYTSTLDRCLDDANRRLPECVRYEPIHQWYAADYDAAEKYIDDMKDCDYSKTQLRLGLVAAAGIGLAVGAALYAIGTR